MTKPASQKDTLTITGEQGKSKERSLADATLDPLAGAAVTVHSMSKPLFGENDLSEMYLALHERARDVRQNKLASVEDMLTAQAAALNAIFYELTRRSGANMGEYIEAAERYMRLALKTQNQCRATLETLAAIKNPPVVYARQANIAAGPQQVNNGVGSAPRAEKTRSQPNELLEDDNGNRLDGGAARPPEPGDPQMVSLDPVDRSANGGR